MLVAELFAFDMPVVPLLTRTAIALILLLSLATFWLYASKRAVRHGNRPWLHRLVYLAYLALILMLAVTSFGSLVQTGHLGGYALQAHVAVAGGFVFLLVLVAFFVLPNGEEDYLDSQVSTGWWAQRWSAWGLVLCSLLAAGTMLVSMLPLLGTEGLLDMAMLHRYAGLAVVVFAILNLYTRICERFGWR